MRRLKKMKADLVPTPKNILKFFYYIKPQYIHIFIYSYDWHAGNVALLCAHKFQAGVRWSVRRKELTYTLAAHLAYLKSHPRHGKVRAAKAAGLGAFH